MAPTPAFRQIHLDFHTSPLIPDVGAGFDAKEFAEVLSEAAVNSVTLFAKCHHGHLYFETKHPAHHPTLKRPLLEEQIEALRGKGIRAPIYLSVQCDEFAANTHPEWLALTPEGERVGRKPFGAEAFSWQILDMSSPYLDFLEEQVVEVMEKFQPVDGLFFDMCWDQVSASNWAKEKMSAQKLDPQLAGDRALYARRVTHIYMERLTNLVERFQRDVPVWYNSRPLIQARDEKRFFKHMEIEALPSGQWGYAYFPIHVRLVKPLGRPLLGMTGRFHKSWADFGGLRTADSLIYDCAQSLAHGAACSIGDQLHPSGRMDRGVYEIIGKTYQYVERCEPWVRDARFVKEIVVLYRDPATCPLADSVHEGAMRVLTQLSYQFVFLLPDDPWEDYAAVYVPETIDSTPELEQRLKAYLQRGGAVLREDLTGEPSPFTCTYLRFEGTARGSLPMTDHVFYEPGVRLTPAEGDQVLARIVEPYFERAWNHFSSHAQTPAKLEPSPYAAGTIRGRLATFALPVLRAYARHANLPCRQLVAAALAALLPQPVLRFQGPSYVEAVVSDQSSGRVVHLLSYIPQKRTATMEMVEEAVAARNMVLDLKVEGIVKKVTRQPQNQEVPFAQHGDRIKVSLDWIEGHQMLVASRE
jgi:hypothetical protein